MTTRLIVHCDWSTSDKKRWACTARWNDRRFYVATPEPVGPLDCFFAGLRSEEPAYGILAGFDFPIGIPKAYAERASVGRFVEALLRFGEGEFANFYTPADEAFEISLQRPFFPARPGGTSKQQLVDGLGLSSPAELLRRCDMATSARPGACEIFWTLGAKQVGRAAISGWRDLLAPALRRGEIALWPFEGELPWLIESGRIVVAETYPTETYSHVGVSVGFGKRIQERRAEQANAIFGWCDRHDVSIESALDSKIRDGFGRSEDAEDEFDSFIGVLGMIEVVQIPAQFVEPDDPYIREIEGWILGLDAAHRCSGVQGEAPERPASQGR